MVAKKSDYAKLSEAMSNSKPRKVQQYEIDAMLEKAVRQSRQKQLVLDLCDKGQTNIMDIIKGEK